MQEGLVERDTEVRLLVLAALAGEHVLFIGPPGTAKSEVGRRLSALIEGSYFERLLTRFSVPEVGMSLLAQVLVITRACSSSQCSMHHQIPQQFPSQTSTIPLTT